MSVKISEIRHVGGMGYAAWGNIEEAKGNECNQYKSTPAVRHQLGVSSTWHNLAKPFLAPPKTFSQRLIVMGKYG
jgi:hypothetical protein